MTNDFYSTFFSGHFLFDKCTPYGLSPSIVSVDLQQSLSSWVHGTLHGYLTGPRLAYIPVEVTLHTILSCSSQFFGITILWDISRQSVFDDFAKNCLMLSASGPQNGMMFLLIKSAVVSTGSSQLGLKRTVKQLERRKWRMNPPNTAQIVKTRLLEKFLPSESLLSLSVTLGILNLKITS